MWQQSNKFLLGCFLPGTLHRDEVSLHLKNPHSLRECNQCRIHVLCPFHKTDPIESHTAQHNLHTCLALYGVNHPQILHSKSRLRNFCSKGAPYTRKNASPHFLPATGSWFVHLAARHSAVSAKPSAPLHFPHASQGLTPAPARRSPHSKCIWVGHIKLGHTSGVLGGLMTSELVAAKPTGSCSGYRSQNSTNLAVLFICCDSTPFADKE